METSIFVFFVIIASSIFHEYGHALMARELGDDTAERAGRLTLNPLVHIDPVGTILVPLFFIYTAGIFIGWAKPVPYNPMALRDRKYGSLKVGIAGPGMNILIAVILGLFLRFYALPYHGLSSFYFFISMTVYINIFLALFNLLPFPPLDGSKIFADLFPRQFGKFIYSSGFFGIWIAMVVSMIIAPPLARIIFYLIVGSFLGF